MRLAVKVVPAASRDRVAGWLGGVLKVTVSAPPERGKANQAVAALLAKALAVPLSAVRLVDGAASPRKAFEIDLDGDEVRRRLSPSGPLAPPLRDKAPRRESS